MICARLRRGICHHPVLINPRSHVTSYPQIQGVPSPCNVLFYAPLHIVKRPRFLSPDEHNRITCHPVTCVPTSSKENSDRHQIESSGNVETTPKYRMIRLTLCLNCFLICTIYFSDVDDHVHALMFVQLNLFISYTQVPIISNNA